MSFPKRQAIVSLAAIAGAQLTPLILSPPQPGQSSSFLQCAGESIEAVRQNVQQAVEPPVHEGYYDVRLHRDVEVYHPPTVGATDYQGANPDAPPGGNQAGESQPGTVSSVLPTGMNEADYQAKRHALRGGGY